MKDMLGRLANGLRVTFLGGLSLFWLAPLIPLIVIVPEFVQHIAEIDLGMFGSKDAFNALANDPMRWAFGYFKVAGVILATLAAARFIGGAGKRWWDLRTIAWKQFLIALALNIGSGLVGYAIKEAMDGDVPLVLDYGFQIATLPLLIYLVGPLWGDTSMTLRRAYTVGWIATLFAAFLSMLAFAPAQMLHEYNHTLAMGQSDAVVWGLMVWDSLLVGLMCCWMGAGLAAGYWLGRPPVLDSQVNMAETPEGQPA
ncbi:hypothetical protein K3152_12465 [Qipengyuania sp. 1NDH17]|uniref:Uncharacterized protein n=1 Tax=Qipengyuania polymorpha TaxID=2867234 RepID=A0ABS7IZR4_9SPHN|nr:hypothetical protein [Qipengyuania polymorpha]MBX7459065.1 hypothetical protein [Qipengyuania polymorpha]